MVFDPENSRVIVTTCDSDEGDCALSIGDAFTGFAFFNLKTKSFSRVFSGLPPADSVSLNPNSNLLMAASDTLDETTGGLEVFNTKRRAVCKLKDANLLQLEDPDAVAFDPSTNLLVVGNFTDSVFVVINLKGASLSGTAPGCLLNEHGTLPNSALVPTKADYVGVSVNPRTHQAFMDDSLDNLALVPLPKAPLVQLTSSDIGAVVHASLPDSPSGEPFFAQTYPYANSTDTLRNFGYIRGVDTLSAWQFLVRINLSRMAANSSAISTPLRPGHCAGVNPPTETSCSNRAGVTYFPLPPY